MPILAQTFLLATEDAEFFEQEYGISLKGFLNGVSSKVMNMLGKLDLVQF